MTCIELEISGGDPALLREDLARVAVSQGIDVAVQRGGLHRRALRLIVMDVDSTLIRDEVIDLLAARAGCAAEVAKVTEAAMRGDLDFAASLRERVALLAGLDAGVLSEVRESLRLTAGARTLIGTLGGLGYKFGIVSGGFGQVIAPLAAELGIGYVAANELEIAARQAHRAAVRPGDRPGGQGGRAAPVRRRRGGPAVPDGGGRRRRQRPGHDRGRRAGHRVQRQAGGQGRGRHLAERPVPGRDLVPARHLQRRRGRTPSALRCAALSLTQSEARGSPA